MRTKFSLWQHLFIAVLAWSVGVGKLNAQQTNNFLNRIIYPNDYYFALPMYNPAFTGDASQPSISASYRNTQSNLDVNPYTLNFFAQGAVPSLKSGIGINFQYHKFDDTYVNQAQERLPTNKRQMNIGLMYSYMFEVGEISVLRIGLGASLLHYRNTPFVFQGPSPQPIVPVNERFFKPSFDIGLSANVKDFYGGIAVKYFNEPRFKFAEPGAEDIIRRNAYIHAGYRLGLLQDMLVLRPAVMVNPLSTGSGFGQGSQPYVDLSLLASFKDFLFAGATYKINDDPFNLSLLGGIRVGNTAQINASYHFPKKNTPDGNTRFEVSLALFLRSNYYDEDF
ncbi:MAG TPA: PorP/SprF family type IX secretion system membrane protein [Chitinophagales bacterium]|nr:PorP/SprF family type IX secretion system membrane protein [Chitinophagales bacterium]HRK26672.1 PorP/SprF family type IX secretion system membrane protein [Chitinophagales bacterium]